MDLEITGRGTQVTVKLRQQAEEGLARIEKILGPKATGKVVLTCEKNRCEVEVAVRSIAGDFASHTSAKEIEAALKEALDKVEAQVIKNRKKEVTTRHHPEHTATGSIRLQTSDAEEDSIVGKSSGDTRRLEQSKTGVGKAMAAMDAGEAA